MVQEEDDVESDDNEIIEDMVFEMIKKPSRVKSVGDLDHNYVSYEQDVIEKAFVKYLVQNNLVSIDVVDCLLKELIEILIERMDEDDKMLRKDLLKKKKHEMMTDRCRKAHQVLIF